MKLAALFCLFSCDDIIERDITREQVELVLPTENAALSKAEVTFRWEEVKGARNYRLIIASPSFEKPSQVYLDTMAAATSITLALQPGEYEWRVQALNAGYETRFSGRSFSLDSASNLTGAQVRLISPIADYYTNEKTIAFTWEPVELADKYILEIKGAATFDTIVYTNTARKTFPREDRIYHWQVTALNATGLVVSPSRKVSTDYTAPGLPELLYPRADTSVFTWPVTLKWRQAAQDVAGDSLFLYLSDQHSLVSGFPKNVGSTTFSLTSGLSLAPGDYFWTVRSYDRAGNASARAANRKFTVR